MAQFLKVKTPEEVLRIVQQIQPLETEPAGLDLACGRVLANPLIAPEPVPHFPRATMDGYAVRARDTFGASESLPALLEVGGEVTMGREASVHLEPGKAMAIPTGGMLPYGADAVVMVEYTGALDARTIEVMKPVAPGDNVLKEGEDIQVGEELLPAGWLLRPQDVGVLAALGAASVTVYRRPRVAVLSTGDEVLPISTKTLPPGKIRDINTYSVAGQVEQAGGIVGLREVVPDDLDALADRCRSAFDEHDVILLSGGSSVGVRDYTLQILDRFHDAELLVHGVAMRPGKPTILARMGKKIFWGLPGQPVSAMMICRAFVLPSLGVLQGLKTTFLGETMGNTREAILARKLPSVHGRADYIPVMLSRTDEGLMATPVFGKSAMMSILARSEGYVIIPQHIEGLERGTGVVVHLF